MRSAANLKIVRELVPAELTLSHERTLPVVESLTSVVPSGCLQRGSTVAVHGVGATSFALAVISQAVRDGSFLAIVAPDSFGLAACLDFDIPLRRVVQFVLPNAAGTKPGNNWAQAVAAIVEGFDVVLIADQRQVGSSQARQLTARNRERGSVLVRVGGPAWPEAADVRFDVNSPAWSGLGQGHGYLQDRQVTVQVAGRRYHGRNRSYEIMLPASTGGVAVLAASEDVPGPSSLANRVDSSWAGRSDGRSGRSRQRRRPDTPQPCPTNVGPSGAVKHEAVKRSEAVNHSPDLDATA